MKVGFTYDLKDDYMLAGYSEEEVAEFDVPETIDGIYGALTALGHDVQKIGNAMQLIRCLQEGQRWDVVFNICEGLHGVAREAQVPVILDLYNIPYVFSDGMVLALTLHKAMAKRIVRDIGIPTAPFFLVEELADIEKIPSCYPYFVKPVAEGTGKGIGMHSLVHDYDMLKASCKKQLALSNQALLVEEYLPGREFTVGLVGSGSRIQVVGVMEVVFRNSHTAGIYSYEHKAHYEKHIQYAIPERHWYEQCCDLSIQAWRGLACRDAGRIDLREDKHGVLNFMEVNPLAGLNPIHSDLPILSRMAGISYQELIGMIMHEALFRIDRLSPKYHA